jgi:Asp/Glu/hydantoin racemase
MRPRILVINPNSTESVTDGLRVSLAGFSDRANIVCCTLTEGPFGIETDAERAMVVPLIVRKIEQTTEFDAFVIACYCDPGLAECRERFDRPIFGVQECAVDSALRYGYKFGVLALSDESIRGHLIYINHLGFSDRLAGELPLHVSVDEATNDPGTLDKIVAQGRRLIDELGADVLILGCAGMVAHKKPAAQALRVPVIEPVEAAVEAALDSSS